MHLPFEINFWHWLIAGVLFGIIEVLAPGFFFLWLGAAAVLVGLLLVAWPALGWEYQVLLFALLSVASALIGRRYLWRRPIESDQPFLNRRGQEYVGRTFTLRVPIENGVGRVNVDDSMWRVRGEDCPAGTRVVVTGIDGTVLLVEHRKDAAEATASGGVHA